MPIIQGEIRRNPEAATVLREAATVAEMALPHLRTTATECACCGLKRADNWLERKVSSEIAAAVKRLRKIADDLERMGEAMPEEQD